MACAIPGSTLGSSSDIVAWLSRYAEGLAVSLGLVPDRALISDINPHSINFYRWLKRGLSIGFKMQNEETYFYEQRTLFNQLIREGKADGEQAASLFYYLNRTCYNGLCRFNSKGEFNVPFGRYKKLIYKTDFTEYVSGLRAVGVYVRGLRKAATRSRAISSMRIRLMTYSLRNTRRKPLAGTNR